MVRSDLLLEVGYLEIFRKLVDSLRDFVEILDFEVRLLAEMKSLLANALHLRVPQTEFTSSRYVQILLFQVDCLLQVLGLLLNIQANTWRFEADYLDCNIGGFERWLAWRTRQLWLQIEIELYHITLV